MFKLGDNIEMMLFNPKAPNSPKALYYMSFGPKSHEI